MNPDFKSLTIKTGFNIRIFNDFKEINALHKKCLNLNNLSLINTSSPTPQSKRNE